MTEASKAIQRAAIVQAMRRGGYLDAIERAGPELDRVKHYLQDFSGDFAARNRDTLQRPDYPLFPGLRHRPFRDASEFPAALLLEQAQAIVEADWLQIEPRDLLRYEPAAMQGRWSAHLIGYMGVDITGLTHRFSRTRAVLESLPGICLDYPWGDALVSLHAGRSHLRAHCSIDNLRLRCHVGLRVPPDCEIRVGNEYRCWKAGRALLFEDSFEHEVWNRSDEDRVVLIVDFWHPDLTEVEIEALTAGFRHPSVRRLLYAQRLAMACEQPPGLEAYVRDRIEEQDGKVPLDRFWGESGS